MFNAGLWWAGIGKDLGEECVEHVSFGSEYRGLHSHGTSLLLVFLQFEALFYGSIFPLIMSLL